jgi:hypothetical protein
MFTANHRFFSHHRQRAGRPIRLLSLLLIAGFLLALAVQPGALQAADTLTEANFSPSLLNALNSVLSQPLALPISADDPALDITRLDLTGRSVSSLKGIEYFTELTSLTADYNKLTNLNGVVFPDKSFHGPQCPEGGQRRPLAGSPRSAGPPQQCHGLASGISPAS